jgi:hypothetical protein
VKPWDMQPAESSEAHAAFCCFRDLPISGRSLNAAYQMYLASSKVQKGRGRVVKGARAPGSWQRWSVRYEWKARATKFDSHLDGKRVRAIESATSRYADEWAETREKFLLSQLRTKLNLAEGAEKRIADAGGLLVVQVDVVTIPGREATDDKPGKLQVERETKVDLAAQLKEIRALDDFLTPGGRTNGEGSEAGPEDLENSWVSKRLRQITASSNTNPSPAKPDSTATSSPSSEGSPAQ